MSDKKYTVAEAQKQFFPDINWRTFYRYCHNGKIPTVVIDGKRFVTEDGIEAFKRNKDGGVSINSVIDDQISFAESNIESDQTKVRVIRFLKKYKIFVNQ